MVSVGAVGVVRSLPTCKPTVTVPAEGMWAAQSTPRQRISPEMTAAQSQVLATRCPAPAPPHLPAAAITAVRSVLVART